MVCFLRRRLPTASAVSVTRTVAPVATASRPTNIEAPAPARAPVVSAPLPVAASAVSVTRRI
jgi:hypothetical protein